MISETTDLHYIVYRQNKAIKACWDVLMKHRKLIDEVIKNGGAQFLAPSVDTILIQAENCLMGTQFDLADKIEKAVEGEFNAGIRTFRT